MTAKRSWFTRRRDCWHCCRGTDRRRITGSAPVAQRSHASPQKRDVGASCSDLAADIRCRNPSDVATASAVDPTGDGSSGKYPIKRRALRGKKPPTGIRPVSVGKAKKHSLAFLIQDDDFPLVPQQPQTLPPGVKRRVPLAKSRAEVLKRLKAITALSRSDFGAGSAVAEALTDAIGIGTATISQEKADGRLPGKRAGVAAAIDGSGPNVRILFRLRDSTSSFVRHRRHDHAGSGEISSGSGNDCGRRHRR